MTKLKRYIYGAAGTLAAFSMVMSPALVSAADSDTANTTVTATVNSTITVTSDGTVGFTLTPGASAVLSNDSDTVTVSTNNTAGYTLTLQDSDATTSLSGPGTAISAPATTPASAAALNTGQWGYAVPGFSGFDGSYTSQTDVTGATSKWAGVPASGSPVTIKTTATTASGDVTMVWYAAQVDSSQADGGYTDTVVYTATNN